jgi:hypothetical protein
VQDVAYSEVSEHLRQNIRKYMECPAIQVVIGIKIPYTDDPANLPVFVVQPIHQATGRFRPGVQLSAEPFSFSVWEVYQGSTMPAALFDKENRPFIADIIWLGIFVESRR